MLDRTCTITNPPAWHPNEKVSRNGRTSVGHCAKFKIFHVQPPPPLLIDKEGGCGSDSMQSISVPGIARQLWWPRMSGDSLHGFRPLVTSHSTSPWLPMLSRIKASDTIRACSVHLRMCFVVVRSCQKCLGGAVTAPLRAAGQVDISKGEGNMPLNN